MDEKQANRILGDIKKGNRGLCIISQGLAWEIYSDSDRTTIYGKATPDQLEAIAWWMRYKHNPLKTKHNQPPELTEDDGSFT